MNNGARIAVLHLVRPSRSRPVRRYGDKFHGLVIVPSAVTAIGLDVGPNDVAIAAAMEFYIARDVDGRYRHGEEKCGEGTHCGTRK
jgi:hypothetical protein